MLDDAIREYREAVRIRPDYAEAHYNLATIYNKKNMIDDSIREFRESVRLRPDTLTLTIISALR